MANGTNELGFAEDCCGLASKGEVLRQVACLAVDGDRDALEPFTYGQLSDAWTALLWCEREHCRAHGNDAEFARELLEEVMAADDAEVEGPEHDCRLFCDQCV